MQKVAVITGGAGGMGLATAKLIGRTHRVLIADVDRARLDQAKAELTSLDIVCDTALCDVTDRKSVQELVALAGSLGTIATVVHTAGLSPNMGDARKILKVNAVGTIHVTDAFFAVAEVGFSLVITASMSAHMVPKLLVPKWCYGYASTNVERFFLCLLAACKILPVRLQPAQAYAVSKHFTIWYTKSQSARFGSKGARIVSVSPGSFDTAMGRLETRASAIVVAFGAIKRLGKVEEIAEVLAFCASEKASYLTGVDILCDGGVIANFSPRELMRRRRGAEA